MKPKLYAYCSHGCFLFTYVIVFPASIFLCLAGGLPIASLFRVRVRCAVTPPRFFVLSVLFSAPLRSRSASEVRAQFVWRDEGTGMDAE